jgi:threonine 3-dehydrogenase
MGTMKALVKKYDKEGLWLDERPIPEIKPHEVLIKIEKTAICGTDVHIYNWDHWSQTNVPLGTITGHEFAGVIEKVGSEVHSLKPGEVVSGEGHIVCGKCRNCLTGRFHLCQETSGVGIQRDGAFAQYLSIPASNVWPVMSDFNKDILSIFDPFGNAAHTALSFDMVGEDVLITGAGPIGIMAAAICKHAGARRIVITDINEYRLNLAKKMGATRAVNILKEDLTDVKKELLIKEGFDIGLEMSGNPTAFNQMIEHARHGAKIALLGILPEDTKVDWNKIIFMGLQLKGIYGREMYNTWYKMTHMVQGGLDLSPVITHQFHYTEFEQGFELMRSGKSGKVILNWNE